MGQSTNLVTFGRACLALLFLFVMVRGAVGTTERRDWAAAQYVIKTTRVYSEPTAESRPFGRVFVATRLGVKDQKPGWLRVEIRGWHQEGAKRMLYALPGKRIKAALISKDTVEKIRPLDNVTDPDTNITWMGAAIEGWIVDDNVSPDLNTIWKSAWGLFSTRCTVCHQRRNPKKYTANQWVGLLKVMGPRTGLPKEQQHLILKYLQNHARDMEVEASSVKP